MVLLVVDTQKLITNTSLYNFDIFVSNVKKFIKAARENKVEVIYIRHDDGEGEKLTKGTGGFEIFEEFAPEKDEKIFDKTVNSPFKDTGLPEYLTEKKTYGYYNEFMWKGRYADCISIEETLGLLSNI